VCCHGDGAVLVEQGIHGQGSDRRPARVQVGDEGAHLGGQQGHGQGPAEAVGPVLGPTAAAAYRVSPPSSRTARTCSGVTPWSTNRSRTAPAPRPAGGLAAPCPDERRIAAPTVQGTRAVLAACPEPGQASSYGGTVVLRWEARGTLAAVILMGWSEVNQRLVVTLAQHLRLVPPRS
jgi:hypothetical protein